MLLIISEPSLCKTGAINGILLCGRVIIPSLFPFMVCVLFLIKSNFLDVLKKLSPITKKLFGLNGELFTIALLSFIGGYPIGAKLLNEAVEMKKLSAKNAGIMLSFCVNAGPAFIISAVGNGVFSSKSLGTVMFTAHFFSALCLCFLSKFFYNNQTQFPDKKTEHINPADNFVLSVSAASSSMLSICSFVILFSCIDSYLLGLASRFPAIKIICGFLEVTNSITITRNIYLIPFFLGFGGICVWFQIFSISKRIKINIMLFAVSRFLHGILSSVFTLIMVKLFKISVPTLSNGTVTTPQILYDSPALAISMLILGIVFAVSITTKYNCKFLEDIV